MLLVNEYWAHIKRMQSLIDSRMQPMHPYLASKTNICNTETQLDASRIRLDNELVHFNKLAQVVVGTGSCAMRHALHKYPKEQPHHRDLALDDEWRRDPTHVQCLLRCLSYYTTPCREKLDLYDNTTIVSGSRDRLVFNFHRWDSCTLFFFFYYLSLQILFSRSWVYFTMNVYKICMINHKDPPVHYAAILHK